MTNPTRIDPLWDLVGLAFAPAPSDPQPCCAAGASEPTELHEELGCDWNRR